MTKSTTCYFETKKNIGACFFSKSNYLLITLLQVKVLLAPAYRNLTDFETVTKILKIGQILWPKKNNLVKLAPFLKLASTLG